MQPHSWLLAASPPRGGNAAGSKQLDALGNGLFILVIAIVLLVVAVTVSVALWNWRAGRGIRNARKLAQAAENRVRRPLVGEDAIRSTRITRK